ncbi:MAG: DUF2867 domain-containing protein [Actinomycetota bacterium]|nr:DUF2867 domain-containing protein [Actinomycetota bacterium]
MRLSNAEHDSHPWRITEIAPDFTLEDVWAIPAFGRADDFDHLIEVLASLDPAGAESLPTRLLFRVRDRLGDWFGWDDGTNTLPIPGETETTLRARLPEDLRDSTADLEVNTGPFLPVYRTDDEWAAELSNQTVHAIMHIVWIDKGEGRYQGQMGVYVKPRGRFGPAYMAAIAPFRHWIVYPALMRQIERAWSRRGP